MFNRSDFPHIDTSSYLDSASTSLTPQVVIDAMNRYYSEYRASSHRGLYSAALQATSEFENARKKVARFIDADESEIIFTSGSTAASHLLITTLEHSLSLEEGDEIVVTELDHHATFVPLQQLAQRKKLTLKVVPVNERYELDEDVFKQVISHKTKIISLVHASNVVGTINPIEKLISVARVQSPHAFIIVDAAQTVGHMHVSFRESHADALFFSGHKMCGPTGVGVLALQEKHIQSFTPPLGGGGSVHSVSQDTTTFLSTAKKFESGTMPVAEVIGLGSAIDYLYQHDVQKSKKEIDNLFTYLIDRLSALPFLKIYRGKDNIGVLAFTIDGVHPHDIAHIAAEQNVALRAGFQCAELITRKLSENGIVRVSVYGYTNKQDIDMLAEALRKVAATFSL